MKYQSYTLNNLHTIPGIKNLSEEEIFNIEVVGKILPFKTNNFVVNELIDWSDYKNDPLFILNFPQKEMLSEEHFNSIASLMKSGADSNEIRAKADEIRLELNPHPAGQLEKNVPSIDEILLKGIQHKYRETVLFFPSQGQTCHAYCTFCFRWPQFVGMGDLKFAMKEARLLVDYLKLHPEVTDILITGGDPMFMNARIFGNYIDCILEADLPNLTNIRIGSKTLTFWPYRYTQDKDSEELLQVFRKITQAGKNLAFMAHFNHYNELEHPEVSKAVKNIRETGAIIRTQSPILKHINDDSEIWLRMWKKQVSLGMVPYYMFIARNTGARDYFAVPLVRSWKIFKAAYSHISGISRTVRGPSMSADPGKVNVLGVSEINGEKVIALQFIQGRNLNWVGKPFFARYNENALWLDELKPAFGMKNFFYEKPGSKPHTVYRLLKQ